MSTARRSQLRSELAGLHDAALAITAELSLDKVLEKIVEVARDLVGARYAALGVAGEDGKLLEFITSGLAPDDVARIAHKPTGRGLLGVLLRSRSPVRLARIGEHASSVGFPDNHPQMTSFLGAPLVLRGKVMGSLYLTDKTEAPEFTVDDEILIEMLAAQAAIAVENARLFAQTDEALHEKVAELQAERLKLRAILDQMPEGVAIVDAAAQDVALLNRAALALLGIDRQRDGATVSRRTLQHVGSNGEPVPQEQTLFDRAMASGESVVGEQIRLCRFDGTCFAALANAAPLYDQNNKIAGGIVVFQDITTLKELDRLKDELVSIISHELRNPLTAIRGRAQLMLRVARRLPERADDVVGLEAIDAQVEKLAQMARELLDVSQMRLGLLELHRRRIDLVSLARQAIEQLRAVDELRPILLSTAVDRLEGDWDGGRLEQVLYNLLENAKKYSPPHKPIEVSISQARSEEMPALPDNLADNCPAGAQWAVVAVRDEGMGIPKEAQVHIFDRLYRAANAKGRAETGLGLGLYICHEIVSQHGGLIWLQSAEGQGTTFYFALPLEA